MAVDIHFHGKVLFRLFNFSNKLSLLRRPGGDWQLRSSFTQVVCSGSTKIPLYDQTVHRPFPFDKCPTFVFTHTTFSPYIGAPWQYILSVHNYLQCHHPRFESMRHYDAIWGRTSPPWPPTLRHGCHQTSRQLGHPLMAGISLRCT
jgi:hypothetical protein